MSRALEEAKRRVESDGDSDAGYVGSIRRVVQGVEGHRDGERSRVPELEETRHVLDAVIDKFKTSRDSHKALLVNFDEQVDARARKQLEYERVLETLALS